MMFFAVAPTATAYYAQAVENMKQLSQPQNASYAVDVTTTGATFTVARDAKSGLLAVNWSIGADKKATPHFAAQYRGSDGTTLVDTNDGPAITRSPIFNPTWSGVHDWIAYGAHGRPEGVAATPPPASTESHLRDIATVRVIGVAYYNVYDAGSELCSNGDAGYAVRLVARQNVEEHPLTHAVIDTKTQQFCRVDFRAYPHGAISSSATVALDIGIVNGMALVRQERIEIDARALFFQVAHVVSTATYSNFAFPAMLPGTSANP